MKEGACTFPRMAAVTTSAHCEATPGLLKPNTKGSEMPGSERVSTSKSTPWTLREEVEGESVAPARVT
jgi:hypothetical protein